MVFVCVCFCFRFLWVENTNSVYFCFREKTFDLDMTFDQHMKISNRSALITSNDYVLYVGNIFKPLNDFLAPKQICPRRNFFSRRCQLFRSFLSSLQEIPLIINMHEIMIDRIQYVTDISVGKFTHILKV